MNEKAKKIAAETGRILIGCVFIFSGFVKAVDPLGSAYKFGDYFTAFGMPWLNALTLPASFILSGLEFLLGVFILAGIYRKGTSLLILLFMIFMTVLTFYLALENPVSDCGCFGDALVISNWETFFKNIILSIFAIIIFIWKKYITPLFSIRSYWMVGLYSTLFIFGVSVYCYVNLPIIDFRPYKIGVNISESMNIPEGAPQDEYSTVFIYEKDGVKQEFTLENYPADDPEWTFVDSKSELIKKGYTPPIHDFTITTLEGDDITDIVLEDTSYTFLLISYKLEKANDSNVDNINEIYDFSQQYNYPFYCLTASEDKQINNWIENTGAEYPICTTDEITLKTIIRSNPGLLLLKKGSIVNKWPQRDLPQNELLKAPLNQTILGETPPNREMEKTLTAAGILFIPLIVISISDFLYFRRKKKII